MRTYVMWMLALLAIALIDKLALLYSRDTERSLGAVAMDAVVSAGFLAWGAFVLGSTP